MPRNLKIANKESYQIRSKVTKDPRFPIILVYIQRDYYNFAQKKYVKSELNTFLIYSIVENQYSYNHHLIALQFCFEVSQYLNEENYFFRFFFFLIPLLTQMSIPYCPTLKPSPKEFKNFHQFVQYVDKYYRNDYGMVKIIPPPDWVARQSDYGPSIDNMMIPGPIQQNTYGKGGVYECLHIQKKSLSFKQYKKKTTPFDKIAEGKSAQDVQDLFWKNIAFSPPLYGADIQISFMQPCAAEWNLSNLDSILNNCLKSKIKGVNTPYCYVGSWKTLFAWHTEDLELSAINYLHYGKSKFWYSIPQNQHHIIQMEAKKLFGDHFNKCSEHLRHKTTVINPYYLKQKYPELKLSKAEHKVGEFILVFGGSYHTGFNFGFNLAQAVNYGTLSWLKEFAFAKSCKCHRDSVKINHVQALKCLQETGFKNAKEVQEFRKLIADQIQEEESQTMVQRQGIKKVFKKIAKKKNKSTTGLVYKGEKYDIDNWYQCDKCNRWRRSSKKIGKKQKFFCEMSNTSCNVKQQENNQFITI